MILDTPTPFTAGCTLGVLGTTVSKPPVESTYYYIRLIQHALGSYISMYKIFYGVYYTKVN